MSQLLDLQIDDGAFEFLHVNQLAELLHHQLVAFVVQTLDHLREVFQLVRQVLLVLLLLTEKEGEERKGSSMPTFAGRLTRIDLVPV